MENNFRLSVMITFYNQAKYVDETLESVFSQKTDFDFEVIVGDDGSSDNTIEKLNAWQKKYPNRIRIFVMDREKDKKYEPIERVSRNRINMLKNSNAEYGIFLDGDDLYLDEYKLQKQVNVLDKNPIAVACGHPVLKFYEDREETEILGDIGRKNLKLSSKGFWARYYLHSDSFLFRNKVKENEILLKDNFDDNIIALHYINKGKKIIYLKDTMVGYRQLHGSSWNNRSELERVYINLKDYIEERENFKAFKRASFKRHFYDLRLVKKNRKNLENIDRFIEILSRDKFLYRTIEYKNKGLLFKLFYMVRYSYFLPYTIYLKVTGKLNAIKNRLSREKGLKIVK